MKRNVSVARNILISAKIIKEMPGSVASGTHCILNIQKSSDCVESLVVCIRSLFLVSELNFGLYYLFHLRAITTGRKAGRSVRTV